MEDDNSYGRPYLLDHCFILNSTATHASCDTCPNGTIHVMVENGSGPFTYLWSDGSTWQTAQNLAPGIHCVTVTDNNGCSDFFCTQVKEGCGTVGQLWASNLQPTAARLNWQASAGVDGYKIRGRALSQPNWTEIDVSPGSTSFLNVNGLVSGVQYEWQIATDCSSAGLGFSDWSMSDTFATGCYQPDSHWVAVVSNSAAKLEWNAVVGSYGYEIKGRRIGATAWTSIQVGNFQSFKDVFGLQSGFSYEWTIRTACNQGGTNWSPWRPLGNFTTTWCH